MAFGHVSGVAANAVAFFVVLENFLAGRGWILVAGGGTTTITYRSTGELGTLTKLYIRIRRDGGNPERIYYRVQDDAAGTHTTTESWYLIMPGLGAVPFNYWISGDKNCVIIVIKAGVAYTGCYIGTLEPFALAVTDERFMHSVIDFATCSARILRRYSGAYDFASTFYGAFGLTDPTVLDGSRTLSGGYIRTSNDEIYGQPFYITYKQAGLGFNSEDTITSGYPAATSDWIAFLCDANIICIMTAGILPLGIGESLGYTVQSGFIAVGTDLLPTVRAFLTGLGWTDAAWYLNPAYDRYLTSPGESGVEDIRCRIYSSSLLGTDLYFGSVDINGPGYHIVTPGGIDGLIGANYPMPYYLFGDLDCFGIAALFNGYWCTIWAGKAITTYPDETIIPHEYKQGAFMQSSVWGTTCHCLRDRLGAWGGGTIVREFYDSVSSSSPNLIDGVTYVLWPVGAVVDNVAPYWIFGIFKYLYRLSGAALSVGDTVQIGGMTFQYLNINFAIRIA